MVETVGEFVRGVLETEKFCQRERAPIIPDSVIQSEMQQPMPPGEDVARALRSVVLMLQRQKEQEVGNAIAIARSTGFRAGRGQAERTR